MSVLHVVFHPSPAMSLREAISMAGRSDRVVALFDDFSFGPINPPDAALRREWIGDELGYEPWDLTAEEHTFWSEALNPNASVVAWTSKRVVYEYTGFLEWLWRFGDSPCGVVDLTDLTTVYPRRDGTKSNLQPVILGSMRPEHILKDGLLYLARPPSGPEREQDRNLWGRLREENAPLRVVSDRGLTSAPLDHFDDLILSVAGKDWRKMARIVGDVLGKLYADFVPVGDLVLCSRIRELAYSGLLESRGDPIDIRTCDVRLPLPG